MTSSEPPPWAACQACGHTCHGYRKHLDEVDEVPAFVHECVVHLRQLETSAAPVHPLVDQVRDIADGESDGRKAWAIWLLKLLEELEDASDAPEVAAEIDNYLLGGHWA